MFGNQMPPMGMGYGQPYLGQSYIDPEEEEKKKHGGGLGSLMMLSPMAGLMASHPKMGIMAMSPALGLASLLGAFK